MHVLVGYDESEQARQALDHALQRYPEATVTAVHVNDPREWTTEGDEDGFQFLEGVPYPRFFLVPDQQDVFHG